MDSAKKAAEKDDNYNTLLNSYEEIIRENIEQKTCITEQQQRIKELEEALGPFAARHKYIKNNFAFMGETMDTKADHFRIAAKVLKGE